MHKPRKRFGQNFLHNPHIIHRIIQSMHPQPDDKIIEIGPGLGALTRPLLSVLETLQVVEIDRDLIPQLKSLTDQPGKLIIHECDALQFDLQKITAEKHSLRLIGNLPYNISTPLIFHLLAQRDWVRDMHFMLQKEVVERITAQPGNKTYGRLSVMVQYYCQTRKLFTVGPEAFNPPPKVDSAIVQLIPYRALPFIAKDEEKFAVIVREAFNHRRKTIANALKGLVSEEAFYTAQINPQSRAEQLSIQNFVNLANA